MEALDEEQTLEGQNQELVRQVADLEAAREQLSTLIQQLNEASRERFGDVFGKIQQQFGGEHGMYRKLFGGGRAEVRLMPLIKEVEQPDGSIVKVETEETDLLESGIEVIAKPPGKEPRSISQLSGGEKTLTAVALLMSIFRSKPSCFCVLDEVDAALDEGNVGRFNSCVRDFTDLSRFIIITHNKRTMQNADHLYGVTQQEKGVSTRVSVKFEQVGKDGRVDVSLKQPANIALPRTHSERDASPTDGASETGEIVVTKAVTKPKRARKPAAAAAATTATSDTPAAEVEVAQTARPDAEPAASGVAASLAKLRELN
jgi:chromosome segregation protein